jgi:peptide/nickel transport system permease protein
MTLLRLILRRLVLGAGTLMLVSVLVFAGTELLPGDIAEAALGQNATPETLQAMRTELHLDRPAYIRYADWLGHFVKGDFGASLASGRSINGLIASRLPGTLLLGGVTALIALPLAIALGLFAAARAGSAADKIITTGTLLVVSGPEFLFATLLVLLFAVKLGWLPATSYLSDRSTVLQQFRAYALPVMTLLLAVIAPTTRMTRSAVLNVLGGAYVETALLKGIPRSRILLRHALPNAMAPIANVIGISLGYLVGGVVVVEVIFSLPGMAKLMVDAVSVRDFPLVQACAIVLSAIYVCINLLADIVAMLCNPRLRHGE